MNYTKGEWTVAADSYGKVRHSRKSCVFAHDPTGKTVGPTVAHAITNPDDAHLISAAPDMYEALGIALDETPGFMLGEDVKQKMRQARAKAEDK